MYNVKKWYNMSCALKHLKDKIHLVQEKSNGVGSTGHGITMLTDEQIHRAQKELGQMYMDKRQWKRAAMQFVQCKQTEQMAECLFRLGDYDMLLDLQTHCSNHTAVHQTIAQSFQSVGMCTEACSSLIKVCKQNPPADSA